MAKQKPKRAQFDFSRIGEPDPSRFQDFTKPLKGKHACSFCPPYLKRDGRKERLIPTVRLYRLPHKLRSCGRHGSAEQRDAKPQHRKYNERHGTLYRIRNA